MRSMNMQIFIDWEQAFNVTQSWPGILKSLDCGTMGAGI